MLIVCSTKQDQSIPPWDPRSKFYKLEARLRVLTKSLPPKLLYNTVNSSVHLPFTKESTVPYILINNVRYLCTVLLNREYLLWAPPRHILEPVGPIQEEGENLAPPLNPRCDPKDPQFWVKSAKRCFGDARSLVDLLVDCQDHGKLPETPLVGLSLWVVGFCGMCTLSPPNDGFSDAVLM
jgi:hypothetical protein